MPELSQALRSKAEEKLRTLVAGAQNRISNGMDQRIHSGAGCQVEVHGKVVSGSMRATSGTTVLLMMAILIFLTGLLMMTNWDTSADVPAVVGITCRPPAASDYKRQYPIL